MLGIVYVASPDDKKAYFRRDPSLEDLWIVSHIEAKKWLQDQFLLEARSIPTQTVLRATEYWQWLFSINQPDRRVVSESLIYAFIEDWFDKNKTPLQLSDIEMFYNFLLQVSPILYSEHKQLFKEWLLQDPVRHKKLFPWWEQAEAFQKTLEDKEWVGRPWILSLLVGKEDLYFGEAQKIHFDLGMDLQHEEVDMILQLSRHKEVRVLVPHPEWIGEYPFQMAVYNRLIDASQETETLATAPQSSGFLTLAESSVVKEVKNGIGHIRSLLEQGVLPAQIGICSPVIEDYWPLLKVHLDVEGIPANKRVVARAISLPPLQLWLSRLQILQEDFKQSHLQAVLYLEDFQQSKISYLDFKKNFTNSYDLDQLRDLFDLPQAIEKNRLLKMSEFVDLLFAQWHSDDDELINEVVDRLMKDLTLTDELPYPIWIKYLELIISRYEIPLYKEQQEGLQFYSLNASDWNECKYLFVFGCEQKHLVEIQRTPLQMEDLFAIERDLGFFLQKTESHKAEFDLRWTLHRNYSLAVGSHSESDFLGDPQLASHYWIKKHLLKEADMSLSPSPTGLLPRWQQLMNLPLQEISRELRWSKPEQELLQQKILQEQQVEAWAPLKIQTTVKLSASQLQKYDECAFKFFVEKILKLQSQDKYDLEIDPMYNGQVLHSMLEQLMQRYPSLQVQREQLETLYETVVQELRSDYPLQKFWKNEKHRQINLVQNFIELEKEYRRHHPGVQPVGAEVPIEGFLTVEGQNLKMTKESLSDQSFPFQGKIDRLDRDAHGHVAIIDYKTSQSPSTKAFASWIQNSQFQMSLYAQAVEQGLAEGFPPTPVFAAEYIFLKNKKRGSGFIINAPDNGFVSIETPEKTITSEAKHTHDQSLQALLANHLNHIHQGVFPPKPKEEKICEKCQWSPVCRAPHLR